MLSHLSLTTAEAYVERAKKVKSRWMTPFGKPVAKGVRDGIRTRDLPDHNLSDLGHVGSLTHGCVMLGALSSLGSRWFRTTNRTTAQSRGAALDRYALAALNRGGENETQRTQSWSRDAPVIPLDPDNHEYL
jgi:hypothetical protein